MAGSVRKEAKTSDLGTVGLRRRNAEFRRDIQDVRIEMRRARTEATRAFEEKYGEQLATSSLIYSDPTTHKDGYYYQGNAPLYLPDLAETYANALVEILNRQPEEDRSKWLTEFFTDLSSVLQFQLPQNF